MSNNFSAQISAEERAARRAATAAARRAIRRLQKTLREELAKDFSAKPSIITKRRRALIQGSRRSKLWLGGNQMPLEAFNPKQTKRGAKIGTLGVIERARVFSGKNGGKFVVLPTTADTPAWASRSGKTFSLPRSKTQWTKLVVPAPENFTARYTARGNTLLKQFLDEEISKKS